MIYGMKHELVSQSLIFPENAFTNACVRTSPSGDQRWWPLITIGTVANNGDSGFQINPLRLPNSRKDLHVVWERGMFLVHLSVCSLCMCNFVFSTSSRLVLDGLAMACDCGTP